MPTLSTSARNAAVDAITALINGGAGDATGDLQFQTAGSVAVATLNFSATAFGAAATGVATANAISSDTNAVGGTTTKASFRNRANVEILSCTVATSGAEINLSSTVIGAGDTVSITSLTITQPAS
jgi:hypothetical protein